MYIYRGLFLGKITGKFPDFFLSQVPCLGKISVDFFRFPLSYVGKFSGKLFEIFLSLDYRTIGFYGVHSRFLDVISYRFFCDA